MDIKEIENSIITTYRNKLWAPFIRAIKEFDLLKENDKVCVCISGGKDSMLLAKMFEHLHKYSIFPFEVKYLFMNPGYNQENLDKVLLNLKKLSINAEIINSDIFEISNKMSDNPCFLCARMRRGALYNYAKSLGCNKIALGHHLDDVIETIMMSIFSNGTFESMRPCIHSTNHPGMELIRPMYYIREKDIKLWVKNSELEFINCACRLTEKNLKTGEGNRLFVKNLIKELELKDKSIPKNILNSSINVKLDKLLGYEKDNIKHSFLEDYNKEKK